MNIGFAASPPIYSPPATSSAQVVTEQSPNRAPVDNRGSVFKPLVSASEVNSANATTEKQSVAAHQSQRLLSVAEGPVVERQADLGAENQRTQDLSNSGDHSNISESQISPESEATSSNAQQPQSDQRQAEAQQQRVEQQQIQALAARDREVRNHERAHAAVGGQYAGAPRYQYEKGPDGINYAVAGEVSISTGGVTGDPQATIDKAQVIRRAALAPAEPSAQDRKVAAEASQMEAQARVELAQVQREEALVQREGVDASGDSSPQSKSDTAVTTEARDASEESDANTISDQQSIENRRAQDELIQRITSSNANGQYQPPGALFEGIV